MAECTLTLRELNRATLARQLLLERASLAPFEVIRHLIAMQGQVSNAPYIGLWTRLQSFQRAELTRLLEERSVVRASSFRVTLHVLTADDYLLFQPILQAALSQNLHIFARKAESFDLERFIGEMRAYVREQPRTGVELRAKMEELYPGMGRPQIADSVRMYMALIQPIPAGLWNFTGRPVHTEATAWLGRPLADAETGLRPLVVRYLAAFGPASVRDMQAWSGLTGLKRVFDELRPDLCTFRDELGRELFDLPAAPRPSADTPAPVRFLPVFDNLLLAHDDRRRFMAEEHRFLIFNMFGGMRSPFLVDGYTAGLWKTERASAGSTLVIEPFGTLSDQVRNELQAEGTRLMNWLSEDEGTFKIRFAAPEA